MSKNIIQSILSFKLKYLPLISVYFAYNFSIFSQIAETFWIKDTLALSVTEVISITICANLPWSMKIIFSQLVDCIKILGSQRRVYTFIAAILMLIGNILTISIANNYMAITSLATTYQLLIIAGFFVSCGMVLQDLIADTLCFEVVDKVNRSAEDIKKEIGNVQLLVRIVSILSSMLALFISGIISSKYSYATISFALPVVALSSVIGSLIIKTEPKTIEEKPNKEIIFGGFIYVFFILLSALLDFKYSQESIFFVGMTVVSLSLYKICKPLELNKQKEILAILVVIFTIRAVPTYGPGIEWWQIDVLGFNQEFMATLGQIGTFLIFIGLLVFSKQLMNRNFGLMLLLLNTIHVVLQLPIIGMAFGLHEWTMQNFGFGAKTIALIDSTAEAPFGQLNFFMLCTIATYYAPKHNIATWFALVMSIMSLAYVQGGRIL